MTEKYTFLFPGMWMQIGGNIAQRNLMNALTELRPTEAVTYEEAAQSFRHLPQVLHENQTFVVHWGPHVGWLIEKLKGRQVLYVAHSVGWNINIPVHVPILAVSRNTLSYWGRKAPNNFLALLPNIVDVNSSKAAIPVARDIDVLVQKRKTSDYVLQDLVPKLRAAGLKVEVMESWVSDLHALMRRSKAYLYDSVEHWIRSNATEGFGLPPIEALACGCTVFSSVNDALADYLDPGFNCHKLRVYSSTYDVTQIIQAVTDHREAKIDEPQLGLYSPASVLGRLNVLIPKLEAFFAQTTGQVSDIPAIQVPARS